MSEYPWITLGLEPTDDERAIRKAYAAKLKVTRPDEDPLGFQALVEARDLALRLSRYVLADASEAQGAQWQLAAVCSDIDAQTDTSLLSMGSNHSSVVLPSAHADVGPSPDNGPSEVEVLLAGVGMRSNESLPYQWAVVFDALEQASLDDHWRSMWMVLNRLVHDLREHMGEIPDGPIWYVDVDANANAKFGPFFAVLDDFEGRFGFLQNDTALFDYLGDDDARDLVNALTAVVGRPDPLRDARPALVNVERIHPEALLAAFGHDYAMLDYYDRACCSDRYPLSFSGQALLMGPFFALHQRLYVSAALSTGAVVAFVVIAKVNSDGAHPPYELLAVGLYLITIFATALGWRRMRLAALSRKIKKLVVKSQNVDTIRNDLANWGQPANGWAWSPIMIFIALKLVALLASSNGPLSK